MKTVNCVDLIKINLLPLLFQYGHTRHVQGSKGKGPGPGPAPVAVGHVGGAASSKQGRRRRTEMQCLTKNTLKKASAAASRKIEKTANI